MSDTSRLFSALILSMATIFAWNYFYVNPKMEKQKEIAAAVEASKPAKATQTQVTNPVDAISSQLNQLNAQVTREEALKTSQRIKISTDRLHGSINLSGGMVDDLTLAKYRQELDKSSPEVVLLAPRKTEHQYFLNTGWIGSNINVPNDNSVWSLESGSELTPQTPVTISFNNGQG